MHPQTSMLVVVWVVIAMLSLPMASAGDDDISAIANAASEQVPSTSPSVLSIDEFEDPASEEDWVEEATEEAEENVKEVKPKSTFQQLFSMAMWIAAMFSGYLVYLFWTQDNVLYHPEQPAGMRRPVDIPPQARLGSPSMRSPPLPFKTIYIKTDDDVRLHAWLIHANEEAMRKTAPTLVYLHGNAGNMAFRLPNVEVLYAACRGTINILMLEYRGYGESTGRANEEGLGRDIDAALKYLRCSGEVDPHNIFVFGRSLGGAVAVRGAVGAEGAVVRGLVLENTFTGVSDMVDRLFPQLKWVKPLVLRIYWPTLERLKGLKELPALFISGGHDQLIPPEHMQQNYLGHGAPNALKTFVRVTVGTHNDTWQRGGWRYYKELLHFVCKHATPDAARGVHVPQRQWWGAWARRRDIMLFRAAVDEPESHEVEDADDAAICRADSAAITSVLSTSSAAAPQTPQVPINVDGITQLRQADLEFAVPRQRTTGKRVAVAAVSELD